MSSSSRRPGVSLVVVGSGPAALSAAQAYREHGGDGRVVMISDDEALPYQRPPLSKEYLRGDIAERSVAAEIGLIDDEGLADAGIEMMLHRRVARLDPTTRHVVCGDGETVAFSVCILATGSTPSNLSVPGGDDPRVHRLRSLADARRLRVAAEAAGSAIVVGSGFIGCEAAASLARRGLRVTLVSDEVAPQLRRLGRYAAGRIAGWLHQDGVQTVFGASVRSMDVGMPAVQLEDREISGDLLVAATGVRPRAELAQGTGLVVDDGRIVVDQQMRTSVPDVLAAGDVVLAFNPTAGRRLRVEHWGEALGMGEVAGAVAAGSDARWNTVPGFWSQIGDHQLKYASWGDGFDTDRVQERADGGFTVWYGRDGVTVGVLTYLNDQSYERGKDLIAHAAPLPA